MAASLRWIQARDSEQSWAPPPRPEGWIGLDYRTWLACAHQLSPRRTTGGSPSLFLAVRLAAEASRCMESWTDVDALQVQHIQEPT
jgi:hypothetical protein